MKFLESLDENLTLAAGAVLSWGVFITQKVFRQDNSISRIETKLDMLLDHFGIDKKEKK